MLREVDLNKNLTKKEYKEMMDKLALKFAALQREARAKGLPVMVVFEGWGASGKGTMISRLKCSRWIRVDLGIYHSGEK